MSSEPQDTWKLVLAESDEENQDERKDNLTTLRAEHEKICGHSYADPEDMILKVQERREQERKEEEKRKEEQRKEEQRQKQYMYGHDPHSSAHSQSISRGSQSQSTSRSSSHPCCCSHT